MKGLAGEVQVKRDQGSNICHYYGYERVIKIFFVVILTVKVDHYKISVLIVGDLFLQ